MDVRQDDFFEDINLETVPAVADKEIKLPLPDEDFNEYGQVKKVRGRMLKKLLKCELKHYFPILLAGAILVIVMGIFLAVQIRIDVAKSDSGEEYELPGLLILSSTLYMISMLAFGIYTFAAPIQRYENNFFKNEGYLTFSIPASMEEHLWAKRLGAIICSFTASVSIIISVLLMALITLDPGVLKEASNLLFKVYVDLYATEPVHAILFTIEDIISAVIGMFTLPCLFGAGICIFSRFSRRKQMIVGFLIGFAVVSVIETAFISLVSSGTFEGLLQLIDSPVGQHIWKWICILFEAGLSVGCFFFELHFLKNKLDLK